MSKIIKLKQSDVEKIVNDIIKENEEAEQTEQMSGATELTLGIDDEGNYYVMKNADSEKPEIIAKTK